MRTAQRLSSAFLDSSAAPSEPDALRLSECGSWRSGDGENITGPKRAQMAVLDGPRRVLSRIFLGPTLTVWPVWTQRATWESAGLRWDRCFVFFGAQKDHCGAHKRYRAVGGLEK